MKLLAVIYDMYPLPLGSVLREAPVGDKYLTWLWVPAPGIASFSCPAQKV